MEEEEALDEALRETFPASDVPSIPPRRHRTALPPMTRANAPVEADAPVNEVIEHAITEWSPTTRHVDAQQPLGEPPHAEVREAAARGAATAVVSQKFGDEEFDVVDEAAAESFPASDPPSWTHGRGR